MRDAGRGIHVLKGLGTGFVNLGSESGGSSGFRNFAQRTQRQNGEDDSGLGAQRHKGLGGDVQSTRTNGPHNHRTACPGHTPIGSCLGHRSRFDHPRPRPQVTGHGKWHRHPYVRATIAQRCLGHFHYQISDDGVVSDTFTGIIAKHLTKQFFFL
jgi:hypothetical protein